MKKLKYAKFSETMAAPDDNERELIVQLRNRASDVLPKDTNSYFNHDTFLLRWIRAREYNLEAAENMLRQSLKWREENNVNEILSLTDHPFIVKNYPYFLKGLDKKGQPVLTLHMGGWDFRKVIEQDIVDEFIQFTTRNYEKICEKIRLVDSQRLPDQPHITQFSMVLDWDEFPMWQVVNIKALNNLLRFAQVYEAHYPEVLYRAFFINTNRVFQIAYALMKPLLSPRTIKKISIYGTKREDWESDVREVIDADQVDYRFGGF